VDRRTELTEAALEYVLAHGLIGLSLRPLAASLGTSDRMLIYHFGSKESLLTEVITLANRRIAASIGPADPPPRTAADLVRYAWNVLKTPATLGTMRLYLEMCVLSVRDPQRWATCHEQLREPWLAMLRSGLAELGVPARRVTTLADLVLDTIDGLLLDRLVSQDPSRADAAAAAFADLLDPSA
jgi:AcrR family transcriptional regulator